MLFAAVTLAAEEHTLEGEIARARQEGQEVIASMKTEYKLYLAQAIFPMDYETFLAWEIAKQEMLNHFMSIKPEMLKLETGF